MFGCAACASASTRRPRRCRSPRPRSRPWLVTLKQTDETFDVDWVERWLRDHIIRHIPGGRHATELFLGLRVVDAAGHRVGTVVDVRLSISGDLQHDPSTPRVVGLIVSPWTKSSFLGYERSSATAPTMLAALSRYRHRGTFLAGWEDVARVAADRNISAAAIHQVFSRFAGRLIRLRV